MIEMLFNIIYIYIKYHYIKVIIYITHMFCVNIKIGVIVQNLFDTVPCLSWTVNKKNMNTVLKWTKDFIYKS